MDRCALFVDAGYVLADGAMAVHGTRQRSSVSWDYAGLVKLLTGLSRDRTGLPVLRCYWYEATVEGRRTSEHNALADLPGVKLRLGRMRPGRREGVEAEMHRDLTTLARNRAVSDAVIVSAEEDLAEVVAEVQDLGLRVIIVHITADGRWTVSQPLRQECDDIVEISAAHLRPFVDLVAGAEPADLDDQYRNGSYQRRLANGRGAGYGAMGHQGLPAALPAAATIYTAPVVEEYQRSAQPGQGPLALSALAAAAAVGPPPSHQPRGAQLPAAAQPPAPPPAPPAPAASPAAGPPQEQVPAAPLQETGLEQPGSAAQAGAQNAGAAPGPAQAQASAQFAPVQPSAVQDPPPASAPPASAPPAPGQQAPAQASAGPAQAQVPPPSAAPGTVLAGAHQMPEPPSPVPQQAPQAPAPAQAEAPQPSAPPQVLSPPVPGPQDPVPPVRAQPAAAQQSSVPPAPAQQATPPPAPAAPGHPPQAPPPGPPPGPPPDARFGAGQGDYRPPEPAGSRGGLPVRDAGTGPGPEESRPAAQFAQPPPPGRFAEPASPGRFSDGPPPGRFAEPSSPGRFSDGPASGRFAEPSSPGRFAEGPGRFGDAPGRFGENPGQAPYPSAPPGAFGAGSAPHVSYPQYPAAPSAQHAPSLPPSGYSAPSQPGPYSGPQPAAHAALPAPVPQPMAMSLADAVQAAHAEGFGFGDAVARDAPALWLEAVLARKPRMPSDLEARLLQGSSLPIDSLLHDEVRHSLRRGFWDALERSRR